MEKKLSLESEIIKNLDAAIVLVRSDDSTIFYTNPAFNQMFGYDLNELAGKNIALLFASTDLDHAGSGNQIIEKLNKRAIWRGEIRSIKKDGTIFWCHSKVSEFHHPEFGRVNIIGHTDISKRKQAEEALIHSNGLMRLVIEHNRSAIAVHDRDLKYLFVS